MRNYDTSCGPMSCVPTRKDGVPEFIIKALYCRAVCSVYGHLNNSCLRSAFEVGKWKLEIENGKWKLENGNWKMEIGNVKWHGTISHCMYLIMSHFTNCIAIPLNDNIGV